MASIEGSGGAPADRLIKMFKDLFEKFKKTPYTIPTAIGITAGLHYLMMVYMMSSCWIGLLPPLLLFGLFWYFDIKRVRKLLLYGFIGCTVLMFVSTAALVGWFQALEPAVAYSPEADPILVDGIVDPFTGGKSTVFTYNVTLRLTNDSMVNVTDVDVYVLMGSLGTVTNESMILINPTGESVDNGSYVEYYYHHVAMLSEPINQFEFRAFINNTWVAATDYYEGDPISIAGPIFSDPWAVAWPIIRYITLYQSYAQFFAIFAILCGMVWWMRRARRMREKAIEQYEARRKEMEAKPVEDDARVPSLSRAMGLEKEPDTFVCSECGVDVPADAKRCPSCGEKFD